MYTFDRSSAIIWINIEELVISMYFISRVSMLHWLVYQKLVCDDHNGLSYILNTNTIGGHVDIGNKLFMCDHRDFVWTAIHLKKMLLLYYFAVRVQYSIDVLEKIGIMVCAHAHHEFMAKEIENNFLLCKICMRQHTLE